MTGFLGIIPGFFFGKGRLLRKIQSGIHVRDALSGRETIICFSGWLKVHDNKPPFAIRNSLFLLFVIAKNIY
jgi:hypothetical protein